MRPSLLAAAGFAFLACGGSNPVEPGLDRDFELAGGASARVDGTDLVIRLEGGGAAREVVELHTLDEPKEATHGPYVVLLVALAPRPVSTRPTPLREYRATLRVRRSG